MKRSVKAKRIALAGRFMAESCFRSPLHLTDTPDKVIIKLPNIPCFSLGVRCRIQKMKGAARQISILSRERLREVKNVLAFLARYGSLGF